MLARRYSSLAVSVALVLIASIGRAQDSTPPAPGEPAPPEKPKTALERTAEVEEQEATPRQQLAAAMQALRSRKDSVVRAQVQHKQPEAGGGQAGVAGQPVQIMIRTAGFGQAEDAFEGNVEAWRDAEGVIVVVSEAAVPGFELYVLPGKTIRRLTYEDTAPGLTQLQAELLSLLDGERFARQVLSADLEHRVDDATGDHVWSGTISRDVVQPVRAVSNDPARMIAMQMTPRVLRAGVTLRLTKDGLLKQAGVTIVRNDPTSEMMRGGMAGRIIIRGAGIAAVQIGGDGENGDADNEKHEIEGVSTVYTLDLTATQASERAKAFKREMQREASDG